jgi:DNA replication protein DnaC
LKNDTINPQLEFHKSSTGEATEGFLSEEKFNGILFFLKEPNSGGEPSDVFWLKKVIYNEGNYLSSLTNKEDKIAATKYPNLLKKCLKQIEINEEELKYCAYMNLHPNFGEKNIVMIGNPGTGKTHLSIALGIKACMQGMNVKFYTAANLSNQLIEAQDNHRLIRLEKQIAKADLLIIDELSYLTFNRHQSELLFKVVADRAERRSVIVSTNLRFSEWTSMFENHTMVTALIDRLTFRSHVLNMNSDNPYRAEHAAKVSD